MSAEIAVDTSALAAIALGEPDAETFAAAFLRFAGVSVIGAPTLVEAQIVIEARRGPAGVDVLTSLMERTSIEVVPFDATLARVATAAWRRFGKGRHPAALNLGDCFSYALARQTGVPLLFKGNDFSQTDIRAVI